MRSSVFVPALLIIPCVCQGHHSRAEFSDAVQEVSGEIVAIDWRNPHPDFTVRIIDDSGTPQLWNIQGYGSLYTLQRSGVTREAFENADSVRIAGQLSTRRQNAMLVTHMLLSDGRQVIFRVGAEPFWSSDSIGGTWNADESNGVDTIRENRGIFRVWSIPAEGVDTISTRYTETALRAMESFDPLTSFASRCEAKGMPSMMVFSPSPYEFIDRGDFYTLSGGDYGSTRTIHMVDAQNPEAQSPSPLGYSVGHWEGSTLVVETTRIDFPYFNNRQAPQSAAMHVLERFTLSEDQSRLDLHMTMTDPTLFTEPAVRERYWLALGEDLPDNECHVR